HRAEGEGTRGIGRILGGVLRCSSGTSRRTARARGAAGALGRPLASGRRRAGLRLGVRLEVVRTEDDAGAPATGSLGSAIAIAAREELVRRAEEIRAEPFRGGAQLRQRIGADVVVDDLALEPGVLRLVQVVRDRREELARVGREDRQLRLELAGRDQDFLAEREHAVGADLDGTDADELVEHRAGRYVDAELADERDERGPPSALLVPDLARPSLSVAVAALCDPAPDDATRDRLDPSDLGIRLARAAAQAGDFLPMKAGDERDPAVARALEGQCEIAFRRLDVELAQDPGERRIGQTLRDELADDRLQQASDRATVGRALLRGQHRRASRGAPRRAPATAL